MTTINSAEDPSLANLMKKIHIYLVIREIEPLFLSLCSFLYFFFFKDFIYLFMRHTHTHTEAETQAEGEAGSMQGAQCGTRSHDSRIRPWAEGDAKRLSHPGCPHQATVRCRCLNEVFTDTLPPQILTV